jgi:PKD repeat protein
MSDLNPMGTFGTGYEVGSYGQPIYKDDSDPDSSGSSSGGGSSSSGGSSLSTPPPETMSAPDPIPLFSYSLKASGRVDFLNESLNAVRYEWTFYLNETLTSIGFSSEEHPTYFYPDSGEGTFTWNVRLRAYNTDGAYIDITEQVEVETLDPVCDFTYIQSGTVVRFTDISTNIDSDSIVWGFGDFTYSYNANPHHTFPGNGTYSVTLNKGNSSKTQLIVIDAEVVLACDAMTGATGYKWERSPNNSNNWVEFADTAIESVDVTQAVHGIDSTVVNFFRVKAYNGAGESDYSDVTNVRCD